MDPKRQLPMFRSLTVCLFAGTLCAQWGPVTTTAAPPAQAGAVMAFDLLRSESVLHGIGSGQAAETWGYAGGIWTQKSPASLPPLRRDAGMVFDLSAGGTLLYGGRASSMLDDTWVFDGTDWTQLSPAATPGGRARFGMAFDLGRLRTVLYGGSPDVSLRTLAADTWEFDGTTWMKVAAPGTSTAGPRERMAMCYMVSQQRTVLFGGFDPGLLNPVLDDTWTWDGTQWTQVQVAGPRPAPRVDAQLVDDPLRGVAILCGGQDPVTLTIFQDTWEFDGTSWREVAPAPSPARTSFAMAFDLNRGRMVLFGGRTASTALRGDTWEYGATWRSYGYGCPGSAGVPLLTGVQAPKIGAACSSTLQNLHPGAAVALMVVGTSRTAWAFGSLPASLAPFGMPGCVAYASADLFQVLPASAGTANWTWQVPNDQGLFGITFYQQGLSLDPAANPAGIAASNAGMATLGW